MPESGPGRCATHVFQRSTMAHRFAPLGGGGTLPAAGSQAQRTGALPRPLARAGGRAEPEAQNCGAAAGGGAGAAGDAAGAARGGGAAGQFRSRRAACDHRARPRRHPIGAGEIGAPVRGDGAGGRGRTASFRGFGADRPVRRSRRASAPDQFAGVDANRSGAAAHRPGHRIRDCRDGFGTAAGARPDRGHQRPFNRRCGRESGPSRSRVARGQCRHRTRRGPRIAAAPVVGARPERHATSILPARGDDGWIRHDGGGVPAGRGRGDARRVRRSAAARRCGEGPALDGRFI